MKQVTRYKCDFCSKIMATKKGIERHEKHCLNNPNGFNCYMCEHAYIGTAYRDSPYTGMENAFEDQPICSYYEDEITENFAEKCTEYKRSHNTYHYRILAKDGNVQLKTPFDDF